MMISARNQIDATVETVRRGGVNALLTLRTAQQTRMYASITDDAADALNVAVGDRVVAFFKASHVLVATGWAIPVSARNRLEGRIESIHGGIISAEVRIRLPGGDNVIATVTKEAVSNLALQPDTPVVAIIKASDVMIAKTTK